MALRIYDGLNWIRQLIESNNFTIRQIFYQLAASRDTTIVVWEGKGGNELRRRFYPGYKRNRVRPSEDIFKTVDMFRKLLEHVPVWQVAMPGYEGDDVIASLVNMYRNAEKDITIHSTDKDFRQLIPLGVKVDSNPIKACDDKYIRLYKTLVGDASDSIKGLPGFGDVAFSRLDAKYVQPFFERGQFNGFLPEMAFMEQKHFNKLNECVSDIATYWKITGFFDISLSDMAPHLQRGVLNTSKGEEMMRHYLIN